MMFIKITNPTIISYRFFGMRCFQMTNYFFILSHTESRLSDDYWLLSNHHIQKTITALIHNQTHFMFWNNEKMWWIPSWFMLNVSKSWGYFVHMLIPFLLTFVEIRKNRCKQSSICSLSGIRLGWIFGNKRVFDSILLEESFEKNISCYAFRHRKYTKNMIF